MNNKKDYLVEIEKLKTEAAKFNKIVIWGFRYRYHTHRYIHKAFYKTLKDLGVNVIWVEDDKKNQRYIKSGDLIIGGDMYGKMAPEKKCFNDYNIPVRDDIYYCLYHFKDIFLEKINKKHLIVLDPHVDGSEFGDIKIDEITFFNSKDKIKTLYQTWGTDIMPWNFKKPCFNNNKFVFWVGSIWNDKNNHGNINQINELKQALIKRHINFIHTRFIPGFLNIFLIRISRLAPAIGGEIQVKTNYLPCRMFKNISYGQLAFSNIKRFKDLYKEFFIDGNSIDELIANVLFLKKEDYLLFVKRQQEITKKHTYLQKLTNIFEVFNYIK